MMSNYNNKSKYRAKRRYLESGEFVKKDDPVYLPPSAAAIKKASGLIEDWPEEDAQEASPVPEELSHAPHDEPSTESEPAAEPEPEKAQAPPKRSRRGNRGK